jgi:hypothetical protein
MPRRGGPSRCDFNAIKIREAAPSSNAGLPRRRKKGADVAHCDAIDAT